MVDVDTGHTVTISYAVYSSFSKGFQAYLEGLSAAHSAVAQANGSQAAGIRKFFSSFSRFMLTNLGPCVKTSAENQSKQYTLL